CTNSSATAVGAKINSRYSAADFISPNISLNDDLQKSPHQIVSTTTTTRRDEHNHNRYYDHNKT
ncbi:MAG: hypothetical protein WBY71_01755, partial [Nitrososphaeraceae archaeon]